MSDESEVGYRKPPKRTQFKKGQSGNPKGRPKGSKNLFTLVERALDAKVPVVKDGKKARISKREAAATQLVNKAAGGDIKAFGVISAMSMGRDEKNRGEATAAIFSTPHDEAVIKLIVDRIRRSSPSLEQECDAPAADDQKC
jgi:hypothetical protein